MPTTLASSISASELTTSDPIVSPTPRPLVNDTPRLPWNRSPSQSTYCLSSGSSRWKSARKLASASGVAFRPSRATAASPGSARVAANTSIDTTTSESTA
jgi:hypothetical protein